MKINFNGNILKDDSKLFGIENRAFQYGDSLFETIRVFDGKIPYLSYHVERLLAGLVYFEYELDSSFHFQYIENEIHKTLTVNNLKNARVRLEVFRADGGLYTPTSDQINFVISTTELENSIFIENSKNIIAHFSKKVTLPMSDVQQFKTGACTYYVLAGLEKKRMNWDESILCNSKGHISECSIGNIFIIRNNQLFTPSLNQGCINGVMRRVVMGQAKLLGFEVFEKIITKKMLLEADEIWTTNAIQGIQTISQINNVTYSKSIYYIFLKQINNNI